MIGFAASESRPPSGRKKLSRWLLVGAIVVAGPALAMLFIAFRAYRSEVHALRPDKDPELQRARASEAGLVELSLATPDGTRVAGWLLPSRNGAAVIYVHGSPADRRDLLPEARALERFGYGALLLDVPGHGESGGQATWGQSARDAVRAAVDELSRQGVRAIGAHGFSMGTSVVASVAAHDPRVRAVVLAGVFTNIRDQLRVEFGHWGPLSQWPALWGAASAGLAMDELVPTRDVAAISPRPLLLISGQNDRVVPTAMSRLVLAAARAPKEMLVVPGAGHGGYASAAGSLYFDKLRSFFDRALLDPP
ncbi:MAG: hypothetical protein JWN48_4176 [Myxococcaceae bacterium]|nr:hypothetical protein [Myxococcaceae bacterium]